MLSPTPQKNNGISTPEKFISWDELVLDKGEQNLGHDLDDEAIHRIPIRREFSKETPRPTELQIDEEVNTKEDFEESFFQAINDGDFEKSFSIASKIEEEELLKRVIDRGVTILVSKKKFDEARKLVSLCLDVGFSTIQKKYISDSEKNSDFSDDDIVEKQENPLAEFADSNTSPFVNIALGQTVEKDPLDDFSPQNNPTEEVVLDQNIEDVDGILEEARREYSQRLVLYKNGLRAKKSKFAKILSDLGVDKHLPEEALPDDLIEAQKKYIEAKKKKNSKLVSQILTVPNQDQKPLGLLQAEMDSRKEELYKIATEEYEKFKAGLIETFPVLEKGILGKTLEKWMKLKPYQRVMVSSALLGAGGYVFGGMALTGAVGYAGLRAAKSAVGVVSAQGIGKVADKIFEKQNEEVRSGALTEYSKEINLDNFEAKEKELMEHFDKEGNERKKQILKKGMLMAGTAGISNITTGLVMDSFTAGSGGNNEIINSTSKSEAVPLKEVVLESKPNLENSDLSKEIDVGLSPKGFIQDIHNLKASIIAEYQDREIPQTLKDNILNVPSIKLAEKFNFYIPENNSSGVGFRGETLGVDSEGNIFYEHLDGNKQTLFDSKTGKFNKFEGPMSSQVSNVAETFEKIDSNEQISEQLVTEGSEPLEKEQIVSPPDIQVMDENETIKDPINSEPIVDLPLENGKNVQIVSVENGRSVIYDGIQIAHEEKLNGGNILVLNDKFQDGDEYKDVRIAFATAFEKSVRDNAVGKTPIAEPFENGKIYVSYGAPNNPDQVNVLLNGKEIARGKLVNGIPKIDLNRNLKGSIFLVDNVYERAFKHIKKVIKSGAFDFTK